MRLTYILAVMVVATLHTSATALPSVKHSKTAIKNEGASAVVDSNLEEDGRMLRRVDNDYSDLNDLDDADDDIEEERGLGDLAKKLNPVTVAKKSKEKVAQQSAKFKEIMKDAADYQNAVDKMKEMVYKRN